MKIAVLAKRVPDTATALQVAGDARTVDMGANPKFVISPYDEHAVEAAVQLKEAVGAEVVVLTVGAGEAKETMRSARAMGADAGCIVTSGDAEVLTGPGTAALLSAALKEAAPDLILAGKQAVDDDGSQVPPRVAQALGWPHVSAIKSLELSDGKAIVVQDVEGGSKTCEVTLPAVFSVDKALNKPRYPKLPNIMKAKKKPFDEKTAETLGVPKDAIEPRLVIEHLELPRQDRRRNVMEGEGAENVAALVRLLREEAKAL